MNRREEWRTVLDREVQRWSVTDYEQLVVALDNVQAYEVEWDSKTYQVEIEIVENTSEYLHVMVAVDDGSLPASLAPLTRTFITAKPHRTA